MTQDPAANALLSELDPNQRKAAFHGEGPALVVAGPGSGKTRLIVARALRLAGLDGADPRRILSLTFSNAAAAEMAERFRQACLQEGCSREGPVFSTVHSFCMRLMARLNRTDASSSGIPGMPGIPGGQPELVEALPARRENILGRIYQDVNGNFPDHKTLQILSGEISTIANRMVDELPGFGGFAGRTRNLGRISRLYVQKKKELNLADFDDFQKTALLHLEAGGNVPDCPRGSFAYIQVDEGQDLSALQYRIAYALSGRDRHLFIVADDDQSIYGFRGADPSNVTAFSQRFPGAPVYHLTRNYRSTREIVALSGCFIEKNRVRLAKRRESAVSGKVLPQVCRTEGREGQAGEILARLTAQDAGTTAIIFRNNLSAIGIAGSLLQSGVPFVAGNDCGDFFHHWVLKALRKKLECHRGRTASPAAVLDHIWTRQGFGNQCREICLKQGWSAGYAHAVYENARLLAKGAGKTREFLQNLEETRSILENAHEAYCSGSGPALYLTTAHSSKGLEYDTVCMVDLYEGEFPSAEALAEWKLKGKQEPLEEERRLFFVAMTRARKSLYLIAPTAGKSLLRDSTFVLEVEKLIQEKRYGNNATNQL
ncbi:MAG TPA: hypothetical protein DD727_00320 [Clostridiales bacterium]|nr:hypothetical protein [Clostridiales bacterium]